MLVNSEAEKSMLLRATARRHPSRLSSPAVSSISAPALATRMRPSASVSRMGSVTALMIENSQLRSRLCRRSSVWARRYQSEARRTPSSSATQSTSSETGPSARPVSSSRPGPISSLELPSGTA